MIDSNDDKTLQDKYSQLLSYSHSLESQVETLTKQLEIIQNGQMNLSSKEHVYQSQLSNQARCIINLEDRLFNYEHQSFPHLLQDHYSCHSNYYYAEPNSKYNIDQHTQYFPHTKTSSNEFQKYQQCIMKMKKELKRWKHFAIHIFDMVSDALEIEMEFPKNDSSSQRQLTVELVEKFIQKKEDNSEVQKKYYSLQKQFNELNIYLNQIRQKSNRLTQKTHQILYHDSTPPYELSKIEQFVKQENYYTEPKSLININNHRKNYSMLYNDENESKINKNNSSNFNDESLSFADHIHSSSSAFDLSPKKKVKSTTHSTKQTQKSVNVTDVSIGSETFSMPDNTNRKDSMNQTSQNIDLSIDSFSLEEVSD